MDRKKGWTLETRNRLKRSEGALCAIECEGINALTPSYGVRPDINNLFRLNGFFLLRFCQQNA
jgi:hypothetical protein